jgi:predicted regulator of Ras-like GTPase activity (Roadblock/LC7/MglB family)
VSIPVITEPRYRYHEVAPESISVPVSELLKRLPSACRGEGDPGNCRVDLPCGELLGGNTPRLKLGHLQELLPDFVRIPEGGNREELLSLPGGWLALHFHLKSERIPLGSDAVEAENPEAVAASGLETSPSPGDAPVVVPSESVPAKITEIPPPPPESLEAAFEIRRTPVIVDVVTTPVMEERRTLKGTPNRKRPPRHGIFASLPIFRRRTPEELPATAERPALESRVAEGIPSMPLALEPLWKLSPHDQMADPSALQALFMTEEKLTLDRVMTLAGDLPGLRACVLAHGEKVICTSKTPAGIDLQTLSGQAMTMLSQIRDSSANLGLGAVPAVTLHAEQGALSFLHNGELCLLVLHTDRGFVPGVRERLLEMLTHLSSAKALPSVPDVPSVVEAPQP